MRTEKAMKQLGTGLYTYGTKKGTVKKGTKKKQGMLVSGIASFKT